MKERRSGTPSVLHISWLTYIIIFELRGGNTGRCAFPWILASETACYFACHSLIYLHYIFTLNARELMGSCWEETENRWRQNTGFLKATRSLQILEKPLRRRPRLSHLLVNLIATAQKIRQRAPGRAKDVNHYAIRLHELFNTDIQCKLWIRLEL